MHPHTIYTRVLPQAHMCASPCRAGPGSQDGQTDFRKMTFAQSPARFCPCAPGTMGRAPDAQEGAVNNLSLCLTSARQGTRCSTCGGFSAPGVSNTPLPIWAGPVGAGPVRGQWPLSLSMCRDSGCGSLGPDPRSRSPLEGTDPTESVPQNPAALPLIHLMAQDGVSPLCPFPRRCSQLPLLLHRSMACQEG